MNKITGLLTLAVGGLMTLSCEEIPPQITPCQTNRVVLVEEFTGIDCVNCPTGAEKLEVLSKQNPGKIIVVGIHAGYFATDHNGFDLRCSDGVNLESLYLGPVSGYPAASINRKVFEGESDVVTDLSEWAGYIGSEICERPIAELSLTNTFDAATRKASITVDMTPSTFFVDAIDENLAITVMITESNIVGYQKTPAGSDPAYVHKHVLRDVLSDDYTGDVVITKGNVLSAQQKVISDYPIPADWNIDNCYAVAFIHYKGDNNKTILQAVEAHIK
ncbi:MULTISPECIES: Omp28-related outer membrane protein [unclassified Aureispira]|uniref:Omp28-related outer membrane protein n=1 Tax=unclassified Aureispira TaxID=2649989 RepID=UPI0006967AAE|nr:MULTISPECIES: Omp28-related outer membrane protein [unclassified Aureispira]WMX14372.1 Omp28-related outer membrane protein [Aureispira sp. CCB-E]